MLWFDRHDPSTWEQAGWIWYNPQMVRTFMEIFEGNDSLDASLMRLLIMGKNVLINNNIDEFLFSEKIDKVLKIWKVEIIKMFFSPGRFHHG